MAERGVRGWAEPWPLESVASWLRTSPVCVSSASIACGLRLRHRTVQACLSELEQDGRARADRSRGPGRVLWTACS